MKSTILQQTNDIITENYFNSSIPTNKSNDLIFGIDKEIAAIMLPLIIFFAGFLLQIYFEKLKTKSKLESLKTFFIAWAKNSKLSIDEQLKCYHDYILETQNKKNFGFATFKKESILIDKLKSLDLSQLSNLIVVNHKGDKKDNSLILFKIIALIEKVSNIEKSLEEHHLKFIDYNNKLMEEWNKNYSSLNHSLETYLSIEENHNSLLHNNINKLKERFKNKELNLIDYIESLRIECENSKENSKFKNELIFLTTELGLTFRKWSTFKDGVINSFKDQTKNMIRCLEILTKNINDLENLSFKSIFKITLS